MNQSSFDERIGNKRIVPVVKIENVDHSASLAAALTEGGLPVAEITLRTDCALSAIEQIADSGNIVLGAGTVLNVEQAKAAKDAGAQFIVSPGLDPTLVAHCQKHSIPVYPGISTASELQLAYNLGLRTVKFFPAEACGGVKMLQALSGPFHQMRFMPTGGINLDNLNDYLSLDCVLAVGGSWMVKANLFADGDFSRVIQKTKAAVDSVAQRQGI